MSYLSTSAPGKLCPGQFSLGILAGIVSLFIGLWNHAVVNGYGLVQWMEQPAYYGAHLVLDALLSFPFVALSLIGAWSLASRARSCRGWLEVVTVAACISHVLFLFLVPLNVAYQKELRKTSPDPRHRLQRQLGRTARRH